MPMQTITVPQIEKQLQRLPPEKLTVVYDFIGYLLEQEGIESESFQTMLASEFVLRREWDTPEEDEAWVSL